MPRDIGKTVAGIRAAGEDDTFHFRSDRRQRSTDIVAAVEEGGAPGVGDRLTCRGHQRREPARTHVTAGIRRAGQHNGTPSPSCGAQRGDRLGERVNNDGGDSVRLGEPAEMGGDLDHAV